MSFPERLKKLRNEKNLYQKELANVLGVSRPTITQYENGSRTPDQDTLCNIADFFEVSIDYLLGRTNERLTADIIKKSFSSDPELAASWDKLIRRRDLQHLLKETRDLDEKSIERIIEIIKLIETEKQ